MQITIEGLQVTNDRDKQYQTYLSALDVEFQRMTGLSVHSGLGFSKAMITAMLDDGLTPLHAAIDLCEMFEVGL